MVIDTDRIRQGPTQAGRGTVAVAAAALIALAAVLSPLLAAPATAAEPKLSLSKSSFGAKAKDVRITVTGRHYLVPPHVEGAEVFGGVYVFFGWVKPGDSWGPSNRNSNNNKGTFGVSYNYPGEQGDAGTRDGGDGAIRFVSFTDGGISGEATPYHMDEKGSWTASLTVPGPTYTYRDSSGAKHKVDCGKVTCGVYTIGAHGKASATNEVFTPVSFAAAPTPKPTQSAEPTKTPEPTKTSKPTKSAEPTTTPEPSKNAEVTTAPSPTLSESTAPPDASPSSPATSPTPTTPSEPSDGVSGAPLAGDLVASTSDGSTPAGLWVGLAALVLVGAGALTWWLRRGRAT